MAAVRPGPTSPPTEVAYPRGLAIAARGRAGCGQSPGEEIRLGDPRPSGLNELGLNRRRSTFIATSPDSTSGRSNGWPRR